MTGDLATLEAAAALLAVVRAVQEPEAGEPTAEELAALLAPTADMLGDVIAVAARRL
ncbi:hypothetical protein [Streptomyces sp. OM5714]|uniref:hypothetical protein n=1 Tax=Streptomyces sp. OM5714 TaxID=2602736 RepID=UPI0013DC1A5A|nr:hypothetical protein [Streptomyces sp. OM5714]